ncbi:MAG TPA: acyl-CoA thioesterase [Acidobacteriota bacterium]|nr:acyl-CoA thioesterase [Acidobacteriota bacterium]
MKFYEYQHVVTFEETNVVGNVYYVNYLRWQGKCREMFLRDHAASVLGDLQNGLALVTTHCACRFLAELEAFDELNIRMSLGQMRQNRFTFYFEYRRLDGHGETVVARGEQEVAVMRRKANGLQPAPVPTALREALLPFLETGRAARQQPPSRVSVAAL